MKIPNNLTSAGVSRLENGQMLEDVGLITWNHPNDNEPFRIAEMTGMQVTKNYEEEVERMRAIEKSKSSFPILDD